MSISTKIPRISVLMPAFNRADIIGETIQSILDQSYSDFEFIICDDCSSDNTLEAIRAFDDPRIKVLTNEKNSGSATTRNRLLDEAQGELLAFMDDDDICHPDRLRIQVDYMDSHPKCDVLTSAMDIIDGNSKETGKVWYDDYSSNEEFMARLIYRCPVGHPTMMVRRARLEDIGVRYNPKYWYAEDMHLHCQIFDKLRYENLTTPLYKYRIWDGCASVEHRKTQLEQAIEAFSIIHKKSGIDVSESDKEIIMAMHTTNFPPEMLPRFRKYAYKILQADKKSGMYDSELVKKHLKRLYKNGSTEKIKFKYPSRYIPYLIFKIKLNLYS